MLIEGFPPDSHWATAAQMAASSPETVAEPPEEEPDEDEPDDEESDDEAGVSLGSSAFFFSLVPLETMWVVGSVRVEARTAVTVTLPSMVS